jgi:hypothetical protein
VGKGREPLGEVFQGPFPTDGRANEHHENIDDLAVSETLSGNIYPLADCDQQTLGAKSAGGQYDVARSGRGEGLDSDVVWMCTQPSVRLVIRPSLLRTVTTQVASKSCEVASRAG